MFGETNVSSFFEHCQIFVACNEVEHFASRHKFYTDQLKKKKLKKGKGRNQDTYGFRVTPVVSPLDKVS